jgi:glycosyltransferase involved in cell wall biosynthesis
MTANSQTPFLSVVIPACNPGMRHFGIVLEALRDQTLPKDRWELIVVDDASRVPLKAAGREEGDSWQESGVSHTKNEPAKNEERISREEAQEAEQKSAASLGASGGTEQEQRTSSTKNEALIDLSWHPNAKLVQTDAEREGMGLVSARLRGFELGKGDVFVFVDQDNALRPDYLQGVADIAVEYPHLGTWGGQILLKFDEPEKAPDPWLRSALCTRELLADIWTNVIDHHESTPWGAGLCARREVLEIYRERVLANPMRRLLDPTPKRAGFGGDSDLSYSGCHAGFGKGVFKRLALDHLIPTGRCSDEYLLRNAETNGYSTVLHGFVEHGDTTPPRNDWRFWIMSWLRRPRRKRLEWQVEMARRRGMWKAVREIAEHESELRQYAEMLAAKAERLAQVKG